MFCQRRWIQIRIRTRSHRSPSWRSRETSVKRHMRTYTKTRCFHFITRYFHNFTSRSLSSSVLTKSWKRWQSRSGAGSIFLVSFLFYFQIFLHISLFYCLLTATDGIYYSCSVHIVQTKRFFGGGAGVVENVNYDVNCECWIWLELRDGTSPIDFIGR